MVFSSIPVYLDPPNWHQQSNHHPLGSVTTQNHASQLPLLRPPRQFSTTTHVGGGGAATVVDSSGSGGSGGTAAGSIRPNSMADRARMAKMPQPETALKCPRCESTNTKFCYFNNYSLSQPRHFCKTCRRYWTRGGALRNVPVGGGCRRNKKSKTNSRSKSPASAAGSTGQTAAATGLISPPQTSTPSLPFLDSSIQNLRRYGGTTGNMGGFNDVIQQAHEDQTGFQIGNNNLMMNLSSGSSGGLGLLQDQWRSSLQQIPFLGSNGFELSPATGLYPFQNTTSQASGVDQETTTNSRVTTTSPVKVEDHNNKHNHGGVSLTRPILAISAANNNNNNNNSNNNQFWGGNNAWTDLSGTLNSSSTSHLL